MMKYLLRTLLLILAIVYTTNVQAAFSGGTGSIADPWHIQDCAQLQDVGNYLSDSFILDNDINCYDTINWPGGGFSAIGAYWTPYTGTFDGNHYSINDLFMNPASSGLFDAASGTIRSLGLNNIKLNTPGLSYTGTLVGTLRGGVLTQVFATGETSAISYVGGLVGWHEAGAITDVYTQVKVSGLASGGLVGRNDSAVITNAYANGGGVTTAAKGLIGTNFGGSSINSFYDGEVMAVNDTNGNSTPKTTAQMKSVTTYTATSTPGLTTAWDFVGTQNNDVATNDIWTINPSYNNGYPYFTRQTFDQTLPTIASISTTVSDGRYVVGATIPVTVTFSEPVRSTGPVAVTFETGSVDRSCTFTITLANSGSCTYTVQQGDVSNRLEAFVSGTIADRLGNVMTNFSPAAGFGARYSLIINPVLGVIQGSGPAVIEPITSTPIITTAATAIVPQSEKVVPMFTRTLSLGMNGLDVKSLQEYLNTKGFFIASSGKGSVGNETMYFGIGTKKALSRFQEKNGLRPSVGMFGPKTKTFVEEDIIKNPPNAR